MLFIQYPPCSTCQKAKKWLDEQGIAYEDRNIKLENPSYEELKEWYEKSGLPLKRFFNTSGLLYKSLELKEKLPQMSEEEQLHLLASDGMLVKRPVLVTEKGITTGFKMAEWEKLIGYANPGCFDTRDFCTCKKDRNRLPYGYTFFRRTHS